MSTHTFPYLTSCSQSTGCVLPPCHFLFSALCSHSLLVSSSSQPPVYTPSSVTSCSQPIVYIHPPLLLPVFSPLYTLPPMSLPVLSSLYTLPLTLCISHHLSYQKCFSEAPTTLLPPLTYVCVLSSLEVLNSETSFHSFSLSSEF